MEVAAHDSRDASMKHLADFFPPRGSEVCVHVFQRTRVERFDLGKKRSTGIFHDLPFIYKDTFVHNECVGNFGRGVRL